MSRSPQRGFTVIELMVTLAILGIMMGLGIPAFRNFIGSQKVKSASYEMMTSVVIARSEAVKRNTNVEIKPTTDPDWSTGWTVAVTGGGTNLHQQESVPGLGVTTYTDSTCTTATSVSTIAFANSGRPTSSACFKFSLSTTTTTRCVKVDLTGIPTSGTCP